MFEHTQVKGGVGGGGRFSRGDAKCSLGLRLNCSWATCAAFRDRLHRGHAAASASSCAGQANTAASIWAGGGGGGAGIARPHSSISSTETRCGGVSVSPARCAETPSGEVLPRKRASRLDSLSKTWS